MKPDSYQLRFGPYKPPKVRRGEKLFCEIRRTVTVGGYTDAPIPWPRMKKGGSPCLILCGDLVRAVKREALLTVAHHWGVSQATVWSWRTALGVARWNEGSTTLIKEWVAIRDDDRLEIARRNSRTPAAIAKIVASLKGRVPSAATIEAVRVAAKKPRSEAWKKKIAETWRQRGHRPHNPNHRPWTAEEDKLLGTDQDKVVARLLGRSVPSVQMRRFARRIPGYVVKLSGKKIKWLRREMGWERSELAQKASLDYNTIWNLETQKLHGLARNRAQKLAAALGVAVEAIADEQSHRTLKF